MAVDMSEVTLLTVCGGGRVWMECGSACPPTCSEPGPVPCTRQCVIGCFCPRDRPIWHDGSCITVDECPG